jgi:hypothetical protein
MCLLRSSWNVCLAVVAKVVLSEICQFRLNGLQSQQLKRYQNQNTSVVQMRTY